MYYQEFASDLPRHGTVVFTSVEENNETMKEAGVDQKIRQLGAGKFRCDLAMRRTEQADFFADRFNKAFSTHLALPKDTVGFLFPRAARGKFLASGENVANDKLLVFANGAHADIVAADLAGSEAMAMPQERFTEMTRTLCPTSAAPEGLTVIEPSNSQLDQLRNAILQLMAHPEQDAAPEEVYNLIAATIVTMCHSSSDCTLGSDVGEARRRVAKRVQEFIEAHYREPVRIEDLCRETGVGVRTLQQSFREYFDLTITNYLKAVRLDAAHWDLAASHPSQRTVARIAVRSGLRHLGRFSVEFRERFGESPSATLARQPGQKF